MNWHGDSPPQRESLPQGRSLRPMIEIVRTQRPRSAGLPTILVGERQHPFFVADIHMSALEGMIGAFPRRLLVPKITWRRRAGSSPGPASKRNCSHDEHHRGHLLNGRFACLSPRGAPGRDRRRFARRYRSGARRRQRAGHRRRHRRRRADGGDPAARRPPRLGRTGPGLAELWRTTVGSTVAGPGRRCRPARQGLLAERRTCGRRVPISSSPIRLFWRRAGRPSPDAARAARSCPARRRTGGLAARRAPPCYSPGEARPHAAGRPPGRLPWASPAGFGAIVMRSFTHGRTKIGDPVIASGPQGKPCAAQRSCRPSF